MIILFYPGESLVEENDSTMIKQLEETSDENITSETTADIIPKGRLHIYDCVFF